jgi:hypothetical protein
VLSKSQKLGDKNELSDEIRVYSTEIIIIWHNHNLAELPCSGATAQQVDNTIS